MLVLVALVLAAALGQVPTMLLVPLLLLPLATALALAPGPYCCCSA